MGWQAHAWDFVAGAATTTLEFYSLETSSDGPVIDSISVALVSAGTGSDMPRLALSPVSPNPASGATDLSFELPRELHARLAIVDVQGRTVAVLADAMLPAGRYAHRWTAGRSAAGVYFAELRTEQETLVRRFTVIR